jgi:hypothetical protein
LLDEAKAFSVIKPLYGSISHSDTLLYSNFHGSQLQAITIDKTDPSFRKKPAPRQREILYNGLILVNLYPKSSSDPFLRQISHVPATEVF